MKLNSNKFKLYFLSCLLTFVLLPFGASTTTIAVPQTVPQTKSIVYAMPYNFYEFSTWQANSYPTAQWIDPIYDSLYTRGNATTNYQPQPSLAASLPTVGQNQQSFTVHLKPGLTFSDGTPLTADDVVFSYQVALNPSINQNSNDQFLHNYLNSNSVYMIDYTTVQFNLTSLYPFPLSLMSIPIVSKAKFNTMYIACTNTQTPADCTWNANDGSDILSAGPYMVSNIDLTNMKITEVKNPNYRDAANVHVDTLIFEYIADNTQAAVEFALGNIDIYDSQYQPSINAFSSIPNSHEAFIAGSDQEVSLNHYNPYWGFGNSTPLGITNPSQAYLGALYVRRAMNNIINRTYVKDQILGGLGIPATSMVPPIMPGWDASLQPVTYNLTKARAWMTKAGFNYSDLGPENPTTHTYSSNFFTTSILSPNTSPARNQWTYDFMEELPKIGIGVNVYDSTGWSNIIPRTFGSSVNPPDFANGGFDIFFIGYGWSSLDYNPSGYYDGTGYCNNGSCSNFINYYNYTVTKQTQAYLSQIDYNTRTADFKVLQKSYYQDLPILPIIYPMDHWAWNGDITGIDVTLLEMFSLNWQYVDINIPVSSTTAPTTITSTVTSTVTSTISNTGNSTIISTKTVCPSSTSSSSSGTSVSSTDTNSSTTPTSSNTPALPFAMIPFVVGMVLLPVITRKHLKQK